MRRCELPRNKYLKMSTPGEVRKSVSRINNMVLNGQLEPKTANAIIYGANTVLSSIRTDECEKRIKELEELVDTLLGNE